MVSFSFFFATVSNYHQLSSLKKNNTYLFYYSSGGWKPGMSLRGLNSWYQQLIPSRGSRREPVSLPFLAPRGCLHSLARGASLHPQSQHLLFLIVLPIASVVTWPAFHFTPCCLTLKKTHYWIRPSYISQNHLSISRSLTESHLQCLFYHAE